MTRDEIVKGMGWPALANHIPDAAEDVVCRIERIVRAAEQAEREACAKACDEYAGPFNAHRIGECAAAIRARGEK